MWAFLLAATGSIGRPVLVELLAHGYEVTALPRSDIAERKLRNQKMKVGLSAVTLKPPVHKLERLPRHSLTTWALAPLISSSFIHLSQLLLRGIED